VTFKPPCSGGDPHFNAGISVRRENLGKPSPASKMETLASPGFQKLAREWKPKGK